MGILAALGDVQTRLTRKKCQEAGLAHRQEATEAKAMQLSGVRHIALQPMAHPFWPLQGRLAIGQALFTFYTT
jgi:hypothetical protein